MAYGKALTILTKILNGVAATLFIVMTVLVCLQVFYRYVLNSPLTGSEEGARAILIYVVMLGSAVAVGNRSHMAITYFFERFPRPMKLLATVLYFGAILTLGVLFMVKGYELAERTMMMTTPALQIPRGWIALAFPIGGLLMCLYAVGLIIDEITGVRDPIDSGRTDAAL
jgi:TRAP-type C4-dicarboxylate transport system permease small subunit